MYDLKVLFINVQSVGGEICNSKILNGQISATTYLKHANENIFKEFPNIYVVTCNTDYSQLAFNEFKSIISESKYNFVGVSNMKNPDITSSQEAISDIEKDCGSSCLILNLCDSYYQKVFFEMYSTSHILNVTTHPILSLTLDERLIEEMDIKHCEGHFVMGYYFNGTENENSKEIRETLTKVYLKSNTIITGSMALCYSQIYLLRNTLNVIYTTEYTSLKNTLQYASFNGPGGLISWNSEGYTDAFVKLGKIQKDGSIKEVKSTSYLYPTPCFISKEKICNWQDGVLEDEVVYRIILLHTYNDVSKKYDHYYSTYLTMLITITNDLYDGINGHTLRGDHPYLRNTEEMIEYIEKEGNDENIIAFLGTTSYLFLKI